MDAFTLPFEDENLAMRPGIRISASNLSPVGGGARSPAILLNETAHRLDGRPLSEFQQSRTFDTFHGREGSSPIDWYSLEFPAAIQLNCLEMTMGWPYRDGGWWTSLSVEIRPGERSDWQAVNNLKITRPYNFADSRKAHLPYETFVLSFEDVVATAVRIVGTPGGLATFTSLARLAIYHRDFSHWNPARQPAAPLPDVFKFIPPATIWDLSESLTKLSGLQISFPMMEYYLDGDRYQRFWARVQDNYLGKPNLWILLGDTLGWTSFVALPRTRHQITTRGSPEPYVELSLHGVMASAVAPIVVEDQPLGSLTTDPAILRDQIDWDWHRRYAGGIGIPWQNYRAALERLPHMTLEQMEGIAEMMGMIANSIVRLAHRNLALENELLKVRSAAGQGANPAKETIHQAIDFMEENLEESIGIADVARAVCLNPSYFSTLFAEQVGCTPTDFLTRLRIERAKEFLRHTSMSVMDVCVALDYSPSYFSRLFKKMTGITPGKYARQVKGNGLNLVKN